MYYRCPWDAEQLCMAAAASGRLEVLMYLQQQGLLADTETLTYALRDAVQYNKLAAAKWLKQQGAEWPTVHSTWHWSAELLAWAVAEGFTPPTN
jgi:D-alanyl-D-alanine carboxypeptidase